MHERVPSTAQPLRQHVDNSAAGHDERDAAEALEAQQYLRVVVALMMPVDLELLEMRACRECFENARRERAVTRPRACT